MEKWKWYKCEEVGKWKVMKLGSGEQRDLEVESDEVGKRRVMRLGSEEVIM